MMDRLMTSGAKSNKIVHIIFSAFTSINDMMGMKPGPILTVTTTPIIPDKDLC
jgi:hypothetical protein